MNRIPKLLRAIDELEKAGVTDDAWQIIDKELTGMLLRSAARRLKPSGHRPYAAEIRTVCHGRKKDHAEEFRGPGILT